MSSSLPVPLFFDWDQGNREKNWQKHKVKFQECEEALFDEQLKIFRDKGHSPTEERFLAYGRTARKRKLTVVFTIRASKVRIISARDQNKKERRIYEEAKKNT